MMIAAGSYVVYFNTNLVATLATLTPYRGPYRFASSNAGFRMNRRRLATGDDRNVGVD